MLPTPKDIAAQRIWSALYALLVGAGTAFLALALVPARARAVGASVAGVLAAFGWYRRSMARILRRRRVAARGLAESWREVLERRVRAYARLAPEMKARCEALCAVVLAEVRMQGVGCELSDEDRLLISVSAALPILGFPGWEYEGLKEVLVYPRSFDDPTKAGGKRGGDAAGMVFSGEGMMEGMVILARPELRKAFNIDTDHYNVGIHEFAHLVDRADGCVDGVPPGLPRERAVRWLEMVEAELHEDLGRSAIRPYGHTNRQEFFAVASEFFFEDPLNLRTRDPELYAMLVELYRQDPAADEERDRAA